MTALTAELEKLGPERRNWPNYSKMKSYKMDNAYHCHLIRGNPTYVAMWRELSNKHIEVFYVGTHEKAPY